ncbi:MAG: O-linked N-acetylglucosamine transferase, SPINDLY family protein, partial [Halothece sp. Uz-M2-17]|nr:O-linked N-acetylglucosamine transferase, SPINDLY family protein [Halothece sp. Uz-M2-17]
SCKFFQLTSQTIEINRSLASYTSKKYLRIGYIGHTLRSHSVGWLSRWLISNHHRDKFYVAVYLVDENSDNLTKKLADNVDRFRVFINQSFEESAQIIANDEIDILIDLDSCTFPRTCRILSLKPAPIQVSWLGWDASGLPAIDYYLADPYVLPKNAQDYYQETIWRLPHSYVAVKGFEVSVPSLTREKLEIPSEATVYLSPQTALKHHPDTVRLQMKILKGVPNSYFIIKGRSDKELLKKVFNEISEAEGIDFQRLRFLELDPNELIHRANLGIADVVLDTYPYNGATTTLETLWMGVPLVTKVGEQYVARNSYTFLKNAGVEEGIAWTDEEYVQWGVKLGTDENLRRDVHWKLLQSRKTSPLWDVEQFVNDMETAYQQMWEKYVSQREIAVTSEDGNY